MFHFILPLTVRNSQEAAVSGRGFDSIDNELNQVKPLLCRFTCVKIKKLIRQKLQDVCLAAGESPKDTDKILQEIVEKVIAESGDTKLEVEAIVS